LLDPQPRMNLRRLTEFDTTAEPARTVPLTRAFKRHSRGSSSTCSGRLSSTCDYPLKDLDILCRSAERSSGQLYPSRQSYSITVCRQHNAAREYTAWHSEDVDIMCLGQCPVISAGGVLVRFILSLNSGLPRAWVCVYYAFCLVFLKNEAMPHVLPRDWCPSR
jgi:hypothetical protein